MPSELTSAFLAGRLGEFVPKRPGDLPAAALVDRSRTDRVRLAAALTEFNARLGAPPPVLAACRRLAEPGVLVVAAGQQTGLLTGPLYTVVKALTAAALAGELEALGHPTVAVFWAATQDADTAEMDHARIIDAAERLHTLRVELPRNHPAGSIPLAAAWVEQVAGWIERRADLPYALDAGLLVRDAAAPAATYGEWFAALLLRLLAARAIPVLDPMQPAIAALAAPLLAAELEDPAASATAITEAGRRLAGAGLHAQLHRHPDATNLFLQEEDGQRQALRWRDGRLATPAREYTLPELRAVLAGEPWRITPAAGLRPVVQDLVMPTAVSVVGSSELAYLAQLQGVYARHGLEPALPWLRPSVTLVEPGVQRILTRHGLDPPSFLADPAGAERRAQVDAAGLGQALQSARAQIQEALDGLQSRFQALVDEPLARSVERSRRGVLGHLERLERLAARAQEGRDQSVARQFQRLRTHLLPAGLPQDRSLTILSPWLRHGPRVVGALADRGLQGPHTVTL